MEDSTDKEVWQACLDRAAKRFPGDGCLVEYILFLEDRLRNSEFLVLQESGVDPDNYSWDVLALDWVENPDLAKAKCNALLTFTKCAVK